MWAASRSNILFTGNYRDMVYPEHIGQPGIFQSGCPQS